MNTKARKVTALKFEVSRARVLARNAATGRSSAVLLVSDPAAAGAAFGVFHDVFVGSVARQMFLSQLG